jgi:hypothetical protein
MSRDRGDLVDRGVYARQLCAARFPGVRYASAVLHPGVGLVRVFPRRYLADPALARYYRQPRTGRAIDHTRRKRSRASNVYAEPDTHLDTYVDRDTNLDAPTLDDRDGDEHTDRHLFASAFTGVNDSSGHVDSDAQCDANAEPYRHASYDTGVSNADRHGRWYTANGCAIGDSDPHADADALAVGNADASTYTDPECDAESNADVKEPVADNNGDADGDVAAGVDTYAHRITIFDADGDSHADTDTVAHADADAVAHCDPHADGP